jgi:hypothetical protein
MNYYNIVTLILGTVMNSRYCCVVDLIRVIGLGSLGINVLVCMIGEDSPVVGLRTVVGRAFRSLCCKAKGQTVGRPSHPLSGTSSLPILPLGHREREQVHV